MEWMDKRCLHLISLYQDKPTLWGPIHTLYTNWITKSLMPVAMYVWIVADGWTNGNLSSSFQ